MTDNIMVAQQQQEAEKNNKEDEEPELEDEFIPTSNFSIAIHTILNQAQQSHGVPHHDYTQYRSYLTRRLSRIRHAKPVLRSLSHGNRSNSSQKQKKGGKHAFQPRDEITLDQASSHENFLLDGMFTTERAWAHGMELKTLYKELTTTATTGGSGPTVASFKKKNQTSPGKVRQHYLNRLKKSVDHVENLERIGIKGVCDDRTCLELQCYAAWIKGNYYCEIKQWKDACLQFAMALKLCFQISKSTKSILSNINLKAIGEGSEGAVTTSLTAESLQLSDFFHSRGTNIIQPLLRYCKYELMQEGSLPKEEVSAICYVPIITTDGDDDDELDNEFIQEKKLESGNNHDDNDDKLSTITFRGQSVLMEDPNMKLAMIKIDTTTEELNKMNAKKKKKVKASAKDSKFMELLNCYDDAIAIAEHSSRDYESMISSGPAVKNKRFECSVVLGFFKYAKIQLLMKRNETMVNDLRSGDQELLSYSNNKTNREDADAKYKRVEEIAHLYDALLQDAKSVVGLPGTKEGADDLEDEFVLEANANVMRLRAFRCYYIGRMYCSDSVSKYHESLALFDQAIMLASEAAEEIAACQDMEKADKLITSLAQLKKEVTMFQIRTRASSYLASRNSEASSATSGLTLLSRLDDFDAGGLTHRLADVPSALKPITCKPAFFDIGNNFVNDFPLEELEFHAHAVNTKGSRGFMSWFRQ